MTPEERSQRREQRAAEAERAFQERTRMQFPEFKGVVECLLERAQVAAARRATRDKARYCQRPFGDLVTSSFSSRLRTVLWRRRHDWQFDDVSRWLEVLGIDESDVSDIMERYQKERFDKIYSVDELPDQRGARELVVSCEEVNKKRRNA